MKRNLKLGSQKGEGEAVMDVESVNSFIIYSTNMNPGFGDKDMRLKKAVLSPRFSQGDKTQNKSLPSVIHSPQHNAHHVL